MENARQFPQELVVVLRETRGASRPFQSQGSEEKSRSRRALRHGRSLASPLERSRDGGDEVPAQPADPRRPGGLLSERRAGGPRQNAGHALARLRRFGRASP